MELSDRGEDPEAEVRHMATIDAWLEGFMQGPEALWVVLVVSLLLGLRHASDPDHLAAVTTFVASEERKRIRKATFMGLCWGLGHGTILVLIGRSRLTFWPAAIMRASAFTFSSRLSLNRLEPCHSLASAKSGFHQLPQELKVQPRLKTAVEVLFGNEVL